MHKYPDQYDNAPSNPRNQASIKGITIKGLQTAAKGRDDRKSRHNTGLITANTKNSSCNCTVANGTYNGRNDA